ncbi:MAG: flavodoxin domain-containing protein [Desulfobaccales bacterium]
MKIINLWFSSTGNTEKVANRITTTAEKLGHLVDSIRIIGDREIDLLSYDFIFVGSGVYQWLPGKPLQEFIDKRRSQYAAAGEIKLASPRRAYKKVVVYCTYGGAHTGVNEAVPAVKYLVALFDHLGFEIVAEWYFIGEFPAKGRMKDFSTMGRLGNIKGRPNEADLDEVAERVTGVLRMAVFND